MSQTQHSRARRGAPPAPPGAALGLCVAVLAAATAPAAASRSEPFRSEGATIRIITSGLADAEGRLRGVLEVDLEPGWKTYWRDPGASGVPPQIDVSRSINVGGAELDFPVPDWHEDDYGAWAGYDRAVRFPVTFTIPKPSRYSLAEVDVFLGICQTICIPVQAALTVEPGSAPDDEDDARIVAEAFADLPGPARPGFRIRAARLEAGRLVVDAEWPGAGGEARLFLAGGGGHSFGAPRRVAGSPASFEAHAGGSRLAPGDPARVDYTLAVGGEAVSGQFELP